MLIEEVNSQPTKGKGKSRASTNFSGSISHVLLKTLPPPITFIRVLTLQLQGKQTNNIFDPVIPVLLLGFSHRLNSKAMVWHGGKTANFGVTQISLVAHYYIAI